MATKNDEFERLTIKGILSDKDFLKKVYRRNITSDIYTSPVLRFIYDSSIKHFKGNFNVLTFDDLRWIIKTGTGTDDDKEIKNSALNKIERDLNSVAEQPSRYQFCFNELVKLFQYRKYLDICEKNTKLAESKQIDLSELYQKVQNEMNNVRQQTGEIEIRKEDLFSEESIENRLEQYTADKTSETSPRIPYPFPLMNDYTGGVNPTDLIIFAARQKVGKSIMLLNCAEHLRREGYSGVYFTIEQSKEEIAMREDSLATQLKHREIRLRKLQDAEETVYKDKLRELKNSAKFIVVDMPRGCTVSFIESEIRSLLDEGIDLKWIVIDYLGLIASDKGESDPIKTMGSITQSLKVICRDLRIPIFTAQQMNRDSEKDKKKTNAGIAYSDQQGAHVNSLFALVPGEEPNTLELQTVLARDHEYFNLKLLTHYETMLIVEDHDQGESDEKEEKAFVDDNPF